MGEAYSGKLREVLWFLLASLAIELLGAMAFRSYMLWENVVSGMIDIIFVLVNMWGLFQEDRDNPKAGWRIAFWSDVVFASIFAFYTLGAITHVFRSVNDAATHGAGVLSIAVIATAMNWLCAFKCPKEAENGKSARLKLEMGAIAGGATAVDGLLTMLLGFHWLDIVCTVACGAWIVAWIGCDLRKRWLEQSQISKLEGIYRL